MSFFYLTENDFFQLVDNKNPLSNIENPIQYGEFIDQRGDTSIIQKKDFTYYFPLKPDSNSGPFISFSSKEPLVKNDILNLTNQIEKYSDFLLENIKNNETNKIDKKKAPETILKLLEKKIKSHPGNVDSGLKIIHKLPINNTEKTLKKFDLKNGSILPSKPSDNDKENLENNIKHIPNELQPKISP